MAAWGIPSTEGVLVWFVFPIVGLKVESLICKLPVAKVSVESILDKTAISTVTTITCCISCWVKYELKAGLRRIVKLKTNVPITPEKSNFATNLYWVVGINVTVVIGIRGEDMTETFKRDEHKGHPPAVRFAGMYEREIPWRTCP